jgi:hypothetical protein
MSVTNHTSLDDALRLAELGLRVFPVWGVVRGRCRCRKGEACNNSPGKHPMTRHGVDDATRDATEIRRLWKPSANIGIATGVESGIFTIDVDPRHDGNESLRLLSERLGPLPLTMTARTGGDGLHLSFRHPGGLIKNLVGSEPGIDIRGDGGYIVAPPSQHTSGGVYRWVEDCGPGQIKPAILPALWLDWLQVTGCYREAEKQRVREAEEADESEEIDAIHSGRFKKEIDLNDIDPETQQQILDAVEGNIPNHPGTRNQTAIFFLAKELRGIPELDDTNPQCLRPILQSWYKLAQPTMSGAHDFDDCWADFVYAWPRIQFPGKFDLGAIFRRVAGGNSHPACEAKQYTTPERVILVGVCAELQTLHGERPLFISTHTAARLLTETLEKNTKPMTCHRILASLVADGVLRLHKKGNARFASRYFFIWQPGNEVRRDQSPAWLTES